MKFDYIELEDVDDPRSSKHPDNKDQIRITFAPRALTLFLPNAHALGSEDMDMMEKIVLLAYHQGKEVGKLVSSNHSKE